MERQRGYIFLDSTNTRTAAQLGAPAAEKRATTSSPTNEESSPEPADLAKQAGLAKSVNGVAPEVGSGSNRDDEAQEEPQDTRYIDSEADVAAAWEDVRGVEWWDRRIGVLSPRKLRK